MVQRSDLVVAQHRMSLGFFEFLSCVRLLESMCCKSIWKERMGRRGNPEADWTKLSAFIKLIRFACQNKKIK